VRASFFGVGAPEALLVGVVALVVFGPKGLAQAAKSVGSTLRSFAPTLREITSVSQELKSTLEQVGRRRAWRVPGGTCAVAAEGGASVQLCMVCLR
jgi:TatA/E family protein of Tat protein translocase